jgi:hypothetical protein
MKRYLFLFLALGFNAAWADFSNTKLWIHPFVVDDEPFILDFRGEWPNDCHPGEQKPVISEYTGDTVLIEFESIVEHVVCNDTPTPFRVLVDMSDVVDDVPGEFLFIEVTMRFREAEFVKEQEKFCGLRCDPPPPPKLIKPESGPWVSIGLDKQGLLVARQNQWMGVYPLIYDESGSSEWLLGAGEIVEEVFFSKLAEFTGGQCLGCPPPGESPQKGVVGKISMLMDSEGVTQVKINDGLFETYEPLEFAYGSLDVGGYPPRRIPDLSGRWAFVSDSASSIIPLVFDIALESVTSAPKGETATPPGNVVFSVRDNGGLEVARMKCDYGSEWEDPDAEVVCNVNNEDINDGITMYRVEIISLERLSFDWVGPIIPELPPSDTHIAVRID